MLEDLAFNLGISLESQSRQERTLPPTCLWYWLGMCTLDRQGSLSLFLRTGLGEDCHPTGKKSVPMLSYL